MARLFVSIVVIFCFVCSSWQLKELELVDNGYQDVVVAIGKNVAEDDRIIERIKDVLTKGSDWLFKATRKRAFFRNVTILIPLTWTHKDIYEIPSAGVKFETAHFRIDLPNPVWGDNPYTRQLGGCGEQGQYIHLTPDYLLKEEETLYRWGKPERSIVHEWGHLRWGMFDEYPIDADGDPHFYQIGTKLMPVRCTDSVIGRPLNKDTFGRCKVDRKTNQVEKDCRYYPDLTGRNDAKASNMYMQFLDTVQDFCDDGTLGDPELIHNKFAPNRQNRLCAGMSSWEVMRQSKDFKNNVNPPVTSEIDTTPTFRLVQARPMKIVLLLDASNSMTTPVDTPLVLLNQAARLFVHSIIPYGSRLGIVSFSDNVVTRLPFTTLTNLADRTSALEALPIKSDELGGTTPIGGGLKHCLGLLKGDAADGVVAGEKIFLVTDGEETTPPWVADILPKLVEEGIVVDTIAHGIEASQFLTKISKDTGGESFFYSGDPMSPGLFDAIATPTEEESESSTGKTSVTVVSTVHDVTVSSAGGFSIDSTIGENTQLTFNYLKKNAGVEVEVTGPNGELFNKENGAQYMHDPAMQYIQVTLPGTAEPGKWKYNIKVKQSTIVMVYVVSFARGEGKDAEPIRVRTSFGVDSQNFEYNPASTLPIYAQVTKGYAPVIGAEVTATVERNGTSNTLRLLDSGGGPDISPDDGIYSGLLTRSVTKNGFGRYDVRIRVNSEDDKAKVAKGGSGALTILRNVTDDFTEPTVDFDPIGSFERVSSVGELNVNPPATNSPNTGDLVPPQRINDLAVSQVSTDTSIAVLTWTAVGDDVSSGEELRYDLRTGAFTSLQTDFDKCENISLPYTFKPPPIGQKVVVHVNMSEYVNNQTYYLAIRVWDKEGNGGDPSNIVTVVMAPPVVFDDGEEVTFDVDEDRSEMPPGSPLQAGVIVGIVIACLVVIVAVVLLSVYFVRKSGKVPRVHSSISMKSKNDSIKVIV